MFKKIVPYIFIVLLGASLVFASTSLNFELAELLQVSGGEEGISQNFVLSQGILGEVLGDGSRFLDPGLPGGEGITITATGTVDDTASTIGLEVDTPQADYNAVIASDGTWQAGGVQLAEGKRRIVVTGTDSIGNREIEILNVTVDTIPCFRPTLNEVTSPTSSSPQAISGSKEANTSIWINGHEAMPLDSSTTWGYNLFLKEGDNHIVIFSKDASQNASTSVSADIYLDRIAPTATITAPLDGSLATQQEIVVSGIKDSDVKSVEVNGVLAFLGETSFTASGIFLVEGWNIISAIARDDTGNSFVHEIQVFLDTIPPYKPTINAVTTPTNTSPQLISGIKDADASLWLNGVEIIPMNPDTEWSYNMVLNEEANSIALYVMDEAGRTSEIEDTQNIFLDSTPPDTPIVNDNGVYLIASNELIANWLSNDSETGISEYQYAIGTAPGERDVLPWTSTGLDKEVTINNLGLMHKTTYYFTVKALNFAGSWSEPGDSDGITVNKSIPEIMNIYPSTGMKFQEGDNIRISVSASDADGDDLEYRYLLDGAIIQGWSIMDYCNWVTIEGDYGRRAIKVEVRDEFGIEKNSTERVFIYIEPVEP